MKTKQKKLSDDELLQACRSRAEAASAFTDYTLSAERREVTEYYLGKRPYPIREGGSKFVSQDVYLSVESMKAEIVETFGAGSHIVAFCPQGDDDIPLAKQATAYCEYVVHRQNSGLEIFQDVVHDSLTSRIGFAKVFWDKREISEDYTFDQVSQEQAVKLLQNPKVRLKAKPEVSALPDGSFVVSGEFEEVTDASQVVIQPIPPEEIITKGRQTDINKLPYIAHRYRSTLGDLVDDGYDPKLVYSITGRDDDLYIDAEKTLREIGTRGATIDYDDDAMDEAGHMVTVYESYLRIDAEGTGRQQLWKIVHVSDTMLDKQKVSSHPFIKYVAQPIPHTLHGNNFAARTIQHANTKTTLTRAIIEQAVDATNPRWQVARGGVANPRELLDNRRGGIVNVRSVTDSVAPLPTPSINPFVLQTIGAIDSDREDTTGISRLSQGLDKGALSHQNSAGLVEQLTNNSQTRTKVIARQFALQFVTQLYLKVYQLAIENEDQERMIEIAGTFTPCTPAQWASRRDVAVDMTLGYGERDKRVEELFTLDKILTGNPKFGRMYGEPQAYELIKDALEIKGIKNISRFLVDPKTLGDPEPDPMQQAELAALKKKTEVEERQMALRETQVSAEQRRNDVELRIKVQNQAEQAQFKRSEHARKQQETDNRIDISLAELDLAIDAAVTAGPGNTKLTAIASPNS